MTNSERDELIDVANLVDEAMRECSYISAATPTIEKCRARAAKAYEHLSEIEWMLKALGIPIVEMPE